MDGNNMTEIKEIISTFLKVDPSTITPSTRIDNTAIPGSVMLHRMFSLIRSKGHELKKIKNIISYGDLEALLINGEPPISPNNNSVSETVNSPTYPTTSSPSNSLLSLGSIGVDMESSENLPDTNDFFSHQFYKDNFSTQEIGYCSSKSNPRCCFTGRFAAKEAIIKADNSYMNKPFSEIEVKISENGQPLFQGFNLSISHVNLGENGISIAVAQKIIDNIDNAAVSTIIPSPAIPDVKEQALKKQDEKEIEVINHKNNNIFLVFVGVLALMGGLTALYVYF